MVISIYVYYSDWNVLSIVPNFEKMSSAQDDDVPEPMDTKEPEVGDCVIVLCSWFVVLIRCVVFPLSFVLLQP